MKNVTVCAHEKIRGFARWLSFDAHGSGSKSIYGSPDYYEYFIPEDMLTIALVRGAWLKGGKR